MSETATNAATMGETQSEREFLPRPSSDENSHSISPQPLLSHVDILLSTPKTPQRLPSLADRLIGAFPADFELQFANDPALAEFITLHEEIKSHFNSNTRQIPKYDWDILSTVFEHIYKAYNDEVSEILRQLDALDIKRSIWQESAFRIDTERATKRFKKIESWISNEDLYLTKTKKDLSSSVEIIRNTLAKLNNSDSTP